MKNTRQAIRLGLILGSLVFLSIVILPSNSYAQLRCDDFNATRTITAFSASPSSIIAASGLVTVTETLSCLAVGDLHITVAFAGSNGGFYEYEGDPTACRCIPNGSNTGTIKLWAVQVPGPTNYVLSTSFGLSHASAPVTVTPLIAKVSVSPSSLIGESTQQATTLVTLNGPIIQGAYTVLSFTPDMGPFFLSSFYPWVPTGATSCAAPGGYCPTITALQVPQATNRTLVSYYGYSNAQTQSSTTMTATPLIATVTMSPSAIVGGTSQTAIASFTLNAPLLNVPGGNIGGYVTQSISPDGLQYYPSVWVPARDTKGGFVISTCCPVTKPTPYTVLVYVGFPQAGTSATLTILPVPPPTLPGNETNLGPGGAPACMLTCGQPVNLSNGNTWIVQRDYSLPGLAGGLDLTRTWNSQLQDLAPASMVKGMFGHGWSSSYEERFSFPDMNTVKYWRGDGSAWTFTYDSVARAYSIVSPPDERASLTYDSIVGKYTLTLADSSTRMFSQPGYLLSRADRNGNQTTLAYDASNRITRVTDAAGRSITFGYTDAANPNQATSAQDATGVFGSYTYNAGGKLTKVTYADSSTLNFTYDAYSSITSVTDTNGKVLETHTYDSAHKALISQRANAVDRVNITYLSAGQSQLSDSMGNITTYGYQTIGGRNFANAVSGPGCSSCGGRNNQTRTYDSQGNVASSTDALGNTTTFTYDASGNVLTKSVRLNSTTTQTWTYTYNQFQQVLTAKDPLGNTTTNTYDVRGNLTATTTPSPDGVKPGSKTTFAYDAKGELTQVTDPLNHSTIIQYLPSGLIQWTQDEQLNQTSFTYDARGNRLSSTDALLNKTTFVYDVMNRLTRITWPGNTQSTVIAYDNRGRRRSVTDENGKTTSYGYDDADRLLSVTDAALNLTAYGYDTENRLASITDALSRVTNFAYDALGRVTAVTFPSTLTENYTYDAMGNLLSKKDRNGKTITYTYDNLYRLGSKKYPDATSVAYTYDALNRLTQASDPTGTYGFVYDNLGRLAQTSTAYAFLPSRTLTTSYTYDAASNRLTMTDPERGTPTNYTYDTLNRLNALADTFGNNFAFNYDALSRRTKLARRNNVASNYGYDAQSRLTSVLHQLTGATLDGTSYVYDQVGNRTSKTDQPAALTSAYTYDPIYELQTATQSAIATEQYSYDATGNRKTSLVGPYSYDTSNRLLTDPVGLSYTYDANGNQLTQTVPANPLLGSAAITITYAWDVENRLTTVTLSGLDPTPRTTSTFKYDPFGRRIQKVARDLIATAYTTTNYVYDGDSIIEELDATGAATTRYSQGLGIDEPLALTRAGVTSYYEADGLGSITTLTDSLGNPAAGYVYDSFGNVTETPGSIPNPYRFTGREFDSETGLYYYRARYYDPNVGRFLSEDPAGFSAGIDFYPYVRDNPVNSVDPFGLAQCWFSISQHTLTCANNAPPPVGPRSEVTVGPGGVSSGDNGAGPCQDNPRCTGPKFKGHGPIEPGEYKMNPDPRPGNQGQYRLEPVPPIRWYRELLPGWIPGSQRGGFRLHLGSRTHGCINVLYDDPIARAQYLAMEQLLSSEAGDNWLLVKP